MSKEIGGHKVITPNPPKSKLRGGKWGTPVPNGQMSNWEKEFDKIYFDGRYVDKLMRRVLDKGYTTPVTAKYMKAEIAKQRTQLLKEVREKVIGGELSVLLKNYIFEDAKLLALLQELEKLQLKKLKELEEGKNND